MIRSLLISALLTSSCAHGSIGEDFGLVAAEGVLNGLTYALAERLLSKPDAPPASDGGCR